MSGNLGLVYHCIYFLPFPIFRRRTFFNLLYWPSSKYTIMDNVKNAHAKPKTGKVSTHTCATRQDERLTA